MAYQNPPSGMSCNACLRQGRDGERQGDTCGDPLEKAFKPLTEHEFTESVMAFRTGVPLPASHPASIARERCIGTLLFPMLVD